VSVEHETAATPAAASDGDDRGTARAAFETFAIETAVGQIFPRDSGNSTLISVMLQSLNGLRSLVGVVRPH